MKLNSDDLNFLIGQGEGYNLEFKELFSSGILRMRNAMDEYGLKGPRFDVNDNWFTILYDQPVDMWSEGSPKTAQKSSQKVLELIKDNPRITIKELAEQVEISDRAAKNHTKKFKDEGFLERIGSDKGGF